MADKDQTQPVNQAADQADDSPAGITQAGTAEFKTVKAGCGIRFDPDSLDEDAGFDFSGAKALKQDLPDSPHSPDENSDT